MYPSPELARLAAHKAALRRDIARCREECAEAAGRVSRPLELVDRAIGLWQRLSPLAKVASLPLIWMVKRAIFRRRKVLRSAFRWGPIIFSLVRGIGAMMSRS
ncbi:MAG TPA: hypothetical protein VG838_17510 [Opitutaceae bacterium]|nr:hypothetical protein [Opitutaceae bacterium]